MMRYVGDFTAGKTVRIGFNTNKADGTPITLAGSPAVSIYKDSGTTESTSGVTLTVDFDARTGSHLIAIDTSSDGTFYSAGSDFRAAITAGTVDAISVVGSVAGSFSIANRSALRPTTADRTLDVSAGGEAGVDWANVGGPTTTVNLSGTTVKTATDVEADTVDIQGRLPAALVSGRVDASVGAMAADVLTASALAANAVSEIVAAIVADINFTGLFADAFEANSEILSLKSVTFEVTDVPAADSTIQDRIAWMFAMSRNLMTQTATTSTLKADDGTTTIATSTDSEDGTTFTRGEWS